MIWVALLLLGFVGFLLLVRWRKKQFTVFEEMGISGPKPNLIWGNLLEYDGKHRVPALTEWTKKYGDVFGFYNGDVPTLVVNDLDLQQRIFVSDFTSFTYRGSTMRTDEQHPYLGGSLLHTRGFHWKKNRSCTSQGFTSYKFKQMMPFLERVADSFVEILGEKADASKEVDMVKPFQALAMDYAAQAAFGIDNSFQRDLDNKFLNLAAQTLSGVMKGFFHSLSHCTSTLGTVMTPFLWLNSKLGTFTYEVFSKEAYKVVELRKKTPSMRRVDLLQCLLDGETTPRKLQQAYQDMNGLNGDTTKISSEDVSVNTTVLFIAAFGTTSTALSYLIYNIAKHPDVQEKMRAEVDKAVNDSGELDYATTMGLKYVNQVMQETLRMYPPVITFTTREAEDDREYDGLKIKAGTAIMAPTYQSQMDPRHWPEPEKFDPDRFSPENVKNQHPLAYQPFGMGPRNCVGMRLAILEILYTAARILQKFRVELGESQKGEMKMQFYAMVSGPANGSWVKFYRRDDARKTGGVEDSAAS